MASQPLPPSRTTSVGPQSAGGMGAPSTTTPGAAGGNQQQNLNQITKSRKRKARLATMVSRPNTLGGEKEYSFEPESLATIADRKAHPGPDSSDEEPLATIAARKAHPGPDSSDEEPLATIAAREAQRPPSSSDANAQSKPVTTMARSPRLAAVGADVGNPNPGHGLVQATYASVSSVPSSEYPPGPTTAPPALAWQNSAAVTAKAANFISNPPPRQTAPLQVLSAPSTQANPGAMTASRWQAPHSVVLEYLTKKGYNRTEAMLRKESANTDPNGNPIATSIEEIGGKKYGRAFDITYNWIDNVLDIYKPELKRLLWPLFVYSYLQCIGEYYSRDAKEFFARFKHHFEREHAEDVRALSSLYEPEHAQENHIAQVYRGSKYRLTLSNMAYQTLIMHLESRDNEGGKIMTSIISQYMDIRTVDRAAAGAERSLAKLIGGRDGQHDVPAEDEGIPGHNPGSANLDPKAPAVLSKLALGPLPMESELMEDVKAELQEHDASNPPAPGQNSLVDQFEQRIKREDTDDAAPSRDALPFPPSTARDVAMEVQRVKENRDRFQIDGRTGGVGPGLSVTMFTFHNTFDSVNCIEFSGDNSLVAVGTAESYIRVWSLEQRALTSPTDPPSFQPSSSRRLVGHSGPVYALSFSPSMAVPEPQTNGHTISSTSSSSQPRYLLSCSADCTIRLWSLDTWTNLVAYKSHNSPVWDVRFSPFGFYFASCSADRTARLWSTNQITPLRIFVGHDSDVDVVAWHSNSAYVFTASCSPDRTVRMWDIQRGSAVRMFTGHVGNITSLSCSPNGKMVASGDDRGEIILWDLARGRSVKRMRGHGRGGIWSLDWSVESSVLVSGGADGTVRVWDVQPNNDGQGRVVGEGGAGLKIDGATVGAGAPNKGKSKKDVVVSPDQISAFPTKKSPVYKVGFTQMNLVIAGGAYLP